ncbi:MAG: hypothetical protein J1E64_11355 [Acetatifactor sp.]|nr:hypothetical protein [Acetatifactor sp.]
MKSLIYFEIKKILERKLNVIAMLTGYIIIAIAAYVLVAQCNFYDAETGSWMYGIEAIRADEEKNRALTDYLTEEYLTGLVEDIQARDLDLSTDAGWAQVVRPINDLFMVLEQNYEEVGAYGNYNLINQIPTEGGIRFYERRIEKVENYLGQDSFFMNYSEAEKDFWLTKLQKVDTPFRWGSLAGMDIVMTMIQLCFYALFVIAVCISPVFASEYESGAAALLLTTKHGKGRLIGAKILAAVLFALLYMALGIFISVVFIGGITGFSGAELPIQLWGTVIPYNWSVGQTCFANVGIMLLLALSVALVTALLSSRGKGSLSSLVVMFVLLMGPAFLPGSADSKLWNQILYLMPFRILAVERVMGTFNSYRIGPLVLSYLGMIVLVYICVCVASLLLAKGGFAKHQVRS